MRAAVPRWARFCIITGAALFTASATALVLVRAIAATNG